MQLMFFLIPGRTEPVVCLTAVGACEWGAGDGKDRNRQRNKRRPCMHTGNGPRLGTAGTRILGVMDRVEEKQSAQLEVRAGESPLCLVSHESPLGAGPKFSFTLA